MTQIPLVRAISSDFDGPFTDTLVVGLASIKVIATRWGLRYTDEIEGRLIFLWGLKGSDLVADVFGLSPEEAVQFYADWIDFEKKNFPPLVEGAHDALHSLRRRVRAISVLTSRPSFGITPMLEHHDLGQHLMHIGTTCGMPFHKPDRRAFDCTVVAYGKLGIDESEFVYVGDTYVDWEAGLARGVPTFIVRTGPMGSYPPSAWGLDIPAEHLIDSLVDLEPRLLELGYLR